MVDGRRSDFEARRLSAAGGAGGGGGAAEVRLTEEGSPSNSVSVKVDKPREWEEMFDDASGGR